MGISRAPGLKEYTVADLTIATNNFGTIIGQGDFGKVYKGWVHEKTLAPSKSEIGMAVAIKIPIYSNEDSHDFERWQSEINILGRHYHPNLIGLLGYCWEKNTIALVFEFMQNDLWSHLFQSCVVKPLHWDTRLKIAIEAARSLAFLHTLEKKVIYTYFKTSNILLDENYNVKLASFDLAVRGPHDEELPVKRSSMLTTTDNTQIIGTLGYCAPEYLLTGNLCIKSDIYSFGVILLELLTGLKSIDDNRPDGEQSLVHWLEPMLSNKINLETIMDVHIEGQYSITAAFQAAELAKKCLDLNPENRPNMRQVVEELKQIKAMEEETKISKN